MQLNIFDRKTTNFSNRKAANWNTKTVRVGLASFSQSLH